MLGIQRYPARRSRFHTSLLGLVAALMPVIRQGASRPTAAVLAATIGLSLGVETPVAALRALVVLPLALVTPGAALCMVAFGTRQPLEGVPRLALRVILSLALYPLMGLCLALAAYRITPTNALLGTDTLILVLLAIAHLRWGLVLSREGCFAPIGPPRGHAQGMPLHIPQTMPADLDDQPGHLQLSVVGPGSAVAAALGASTLRSRPTASTRSGTGWDGGRGAVRFAILIGAFVVVLAGALAVFPQAAGPPFTQFSLAGRWAHLGTVIRTRGQNLAIQVLVTNHTPLREKYRLEPTIDGMPAWLGPSFTLASGGSWSGAVQGWVPRDRCLHRLRIALREGHGMSIGALTLWVRSAATGATPCTAPLPAAAMLMPSQRLSPPHPGGPNPAGEVPAAASPPAHGEGEIAPDTATNPPAPSHRSSAIRRPVPFQRAGFAQGLGPRSNGRDDRHCGRVRACPETQHAQLG